MHRVHREATERVGANRLGRNRRWKRGLAYRRTEETALCSTGHGRNGILFIGRGVAYRKTEETDLCWSATVETGVLFIGRGVAYRKTGLHGILFISTVDLLQPPPATVHQRAPVHPASTARSSTGYCSTNPLHGLLFNHPSTGYCSSSPPPATVQPALHGVIVFIQPSAGSCSSTPNRLN